ncbi:MAG: SprT family zinc-dependent metalloprotease [Ignavibacteria bacterium]|nr:SprT family zinc-dependent metalloprotease [Ignavibacteria bacterium]
MANEYFSQTIEVDSKELTYRYRFSKKAKYLQLRISRQQLELVIPQRISFAEGERFLTGRLDWVSSHAHLFYTAKKHYLFGKEIALRLQPDLFLEKYRVSIQNNLLTFSVPQKNTFSAQELYEKYLLHVAKKFLLQRAGELSAKYGFSVNRFSIRGQQTRWGSCSRRGNISLNYNLLKFRKEVIDYVIVHELCHLRQLNHSRKFWTEVAQILPHYKSLKKELKKLSL